MSEDEKVEKVVKDKKSVIRNWLFILSLVLNVVMFYALIKRSELIITGEQLLLLGAGLIGVLVWYGIKNRVPVLPPKHLIASEVADWANNNGVGLLNRTNCEVEVISLDRALIYFPEKNKTFEYRAGVGVVGERNQDLEETIIQRERSQIVTEYLAAARARERIDDALRRRGFDDS